MKKLLFSLICLAFCAGASAQKLLPGEKRLLRQGWTLSRENDGLSCAAEVPSTLAGALMDAGLLPADLLEGDQLARLDPTSLDGAWTYRTRFQVSDRKQQRYYSLRCEGLNYYADIRLNGVPIATKDTCFGVFAVREWDITPLLKRDNELEIRLERAQPRDLNIGFVDWNPTPPDASMGIVRDVQIAAHGPVEIRDLWIRPILSEDLSSADIQVQATLVNHSSQAVEGRWEQQAGIWGDHALDLRLEAGESRRVSIPACIRVQNPPLWWSHDLGDQPLFDWESRFVIGKDVSDREKTQFAFRRIESRIDEYGHRAYYLNGEKILLLGAGWTDDIFLRDSAESLRHQIRLVKEMGLNCIRFENIWGKDATVYDACDREGILVLAGWSCQWEWESYCGIPHHPRYGCILDEEHKALALRYFRDQVRWLRRHPSLIAWFTGSDRIPEPELEKGYLSIYAEEDDRPYICSASGLSSLSGPSGNKMVGPYEYVGPEYWFEDQRLGSAYGFNTETSIGLNMPQIESLRRMIKAEDLWPMGPNWDAHCTVAAEDMHSPRVIREVVEGQFGPTRSLESFVARAQAVDYDGTRAMFEAFRIRRPLATGVIQWMLNSAWPSLYWQLYDYYGNPTAGYYGVKKGCAPLQILYNRADRNLYLVSSRFSGPCTVRVRIRNARGEMLEEKELRLSARRGCALAFQSLEDYAAEDIFVFADVEGQDQCYAIPAQGNQHDWSHSSWYQTPISRYADLRFVSALPEPELAIREERISDELRRIHIQNRGETVAYQLVLKLLDAQGQLIVPAYWSDNFFSLEPGASRTIECRTPSGPAGTLSYSVGVSDK